MERMIFSNLYCRFKVEAIKDEIIKLMDIFCAGKNNYGSQATCLLKKIHGSVNFKARDKFIK